MEIGGDVRERALELVRLLRDPNLPDSETDGPLVELERITRCPHVSDLMFFRDPSLSDEEVVDQALSYRPFT
ncbi:hypothetical protein [Couchioplanes caeruleus]|uniref:E9imm peptide n=2 Tax=Couchioplanes caeruleus TaxID=56438 RepID=A0A1K0G095_9ACTN|nr:hypothetical protein [Couchioplanes caeruleus]OJF10730.1 hypothetical protein BG844_30500 [Couchioplanes caeruleus subsp. caeruleus]ROP31275.1 hypothetical protein EDD30_4170 [Couchioplanes caeruleus]